MLLFSLPDRMSPPLNCIDANKPKLRSKASDQSDLIHFLYIRLQPSLISTNPSVPPASHWSNTDSCFIQLIHSHFTVYSFYFKESDDFNDFRLMMAATFISLIFHVQRWNQLVVTHTSTGFIHDMNRYSGGLLQPCYRHELHK